MRLLDNVLWKTKIHPSVHPSPSVRPSVIIRPSVSVFYSNRLSTILVIFVTYFTTQSLSIIVDFNSLFTEMFRTSFRTSEVRCEVQKFTMKFDKQVCKQSFWLATRWKATDQMLTLQTGLWISLWTFELRNELPKFGMKFETFQWKVSWNWDID